jgi:hypothetical protein
MDTAYEISHAFVVPALLQVAGASFAQRVREWAERIGTVEAELERVQSEIDELGFALYGISEEDRRAIIEGFVANGNDDGRDDPGSDDDTEGETVELDPAGLAASLVSWAVGVAMGRFDLRLATGERSWAKEPGPFDPLPVCSPGMLTDYDGQLLLTVPPGYQAKFTAVLVDDPGHQQDVTARVRAVFDAVFGREADRWWDDVGVALGAKGGEVGGWLRRGFFDHHLKTYSKSRRKAPILWPIGPRSGSYNVWLYAHRVSADLLFQVLNDVVVPRLAVQERELTELRQNVGFNHTASQRRAIDTQVRLLGELREFRDDLEALAPLWAPDLNDGIVVVLAPLWRLFSYNRAWSNELKKQWEKLRKGDNDWTQLAMRLWPARVLPKCTKDRSLAIAHGLEDAFWMQDPDHYDKWLPRQVPETLMEELVAQRHNSAIAAALQRVDK